MPLEVEEGMGEKGQASLGPKRLLKHEPIEHTVLLVFQMIPQNQQHTFT